MQNINFFQVLIITHIAPGMFERHRSRYWLYPESNVRLNNLLIKHSAVIGSMYTGHHHTDSFKLLYNDNGTDTGLHILIENKKKHVNVNVNLNYMPNIHFKQSKLIDTKEIIA